MEIFEPQNFFDMAEVMANVLTGLVAVAGLLIAIKTYRVAVEALSVWKNEKQFDLEIEMKSKMGEALTILNKLNKTSFIKSDLKDDQIWIVDDLMKRFNDNDLSKIQMIQSGYHNHFFNNVETELEKLRQVSMKAISYNDNDEIKDFYRIWSLYEGHIYNTIYNYTAVKLDVFSKKYNFPYISNNGDLLPLPALTNLINSGVPEETAVETLFDNLKRISKEDAYVRMLNIYRDTFFPNAELIFNTLQQDNDA